MDIINILNSCSDVNDTNNIIDLAILKQSALKHQFKFKYENNDLSRIIFYIENKPVNPSRLLKYCNGLICEYVANTWRVVCMPLPVFEHFDNNVVLDETFAVFPLHDATVINVYYSHLLEKWCYGSKRSFDIINLTWRDIAYTDILSNLCETNNNFENHDKSKTYVFAVTDPRIHLFARASMVDLVATTSTEEMDMDALELAPSDAIAMNKNAYTNFIKTGVAHFGYIMRNGTSSYALESDLMIAIKRVLYKPSIIRTANRRDVEVLNYTNDLNYIITRAYFHNYTMALSLFPQFEPNFLKIRQELGTMIKYFLAPDVGVDAPYKILYEKE